MSVNAYVLVTWILFGAGMFLINYEMLWMSTGLILGAGIMDLEEKIRGGAK